MGERLVAIDRVTEAPLGEGLAGVHLDLPREATEEAVYSFPFQGWVVGDESPAHSVVLTSPGAPPISFPVCQPRPDLLSANFLARRWTANAGFAGRIGTVCLPGEFQFAVTAILETGRRVHLGEISGKRKLPAVDVPGMTPIAITTLGRTGSTWLTWLLGQHPEILAYQAFELEARGVTLNLEILRALTEPSSYIQALRGDFFRHNWWLGAERDQGTGWYSIDRATDELLGTRLVSEALEDALTRIDRFYRHLASLTPRPQAKRYFLEKFAPAHFVHTILPDIYPSLKEVFLVRDPRDMICSILDYDRRRGLGWTRPSGITTNEEYVRVALKSELDSLLRSWRQRSRQSILVRYEDLMREPRITLRSLLSYLGVEDTDETIDAMLSAAGSLDPDVEATHRTSPSPEQSIGRWRRDLPVELDGACRDAFAESVTEFGYADDSDRWAA